MVRGVGLWSESPLSSFRLSREVRTGVSAITSHLVPWGQIVCTKCSYICVYVCIYDGEIHLHNIT